MLWLPGLCSVTPVVGLVLWCPVVLQACAELIIVRNCWAQSRALGMVEAWFCCRGMAGVCESMKEKPPLYLYLPMAQTSLAPHPQH